MSSNTVESAVRAWVAANWTACPVTYENETFTQPEPTGNSASPATWLLIEFEGQDYQQESIGSGGGAAERWVETGAVLVHSMIETNAGAVTARSNATAFAYLLRGLQLPGDIRFRSMSIGNGGPGDEDGKWWALTLRAEWMRG